MANPLNRLKTPFQAVESKIQNLVGIWNGIEDSLMKINMNVSTLQGAEPGVIENIWSALLPVVKSHSHLHPLDRTYTVLHG